MTGYVDLSDPVEDPNPQQPYLPKGKTSLDVTADIRDILGNIVGGGYQSWQDITGNEDAKSQYSALIGKVGRPVANKLITQAVSFNQMPESKSLGVEDRVKSFYNIGSADKDVADVLLKVKTFGYGPQAGIRESSNYGNMALTGRAAPNVSEPTEQSEEIKEIITAKTQK